MKRSGIDQIEYIIRDYSNIDEFLYEQNKQQQGNSQKVKYNYYYSYLIKLILYSLMEAKSIFLGKNQELNLKFY